MAGTTRGLLFDCFGFSMPHPRSDVCLCLGVRRRRNECQLPLRRGVRSLGILLVERQTLISHRCLEGVLTADDLSLDAQSSLCVVVSRPMRLDPGGDMLSYICRAERRPCFFAALAKSGGGILKLLGFRTGSPTELACLLVPIVGRARGPSMMPVQVLWTRQ